MAEASKSSTAIPTYSLCHWYIKFFLQNAFLFCWRGLLGEQYPKQFKYFVKIAVILCVDADHDDGQQVVAG